MATNHNFRVKNGLEVGGSVQLGGDANPTLTGDGTYLKITTSNGYIDIGAGSASYLHITTDRPSFYFNKKLVVNEGIVQSYDEDLNLNRVGSTTARLRITAGTTISDQALSVTGALLGSTVQATGNLFGTTGLHTLNAAGDGWNHTINRNSGSPTANLPGGITSGNITTTGYLRGPSTFTIDPATHGDDTGTLVIAGNLQVDGTTTTVNSTTVAVSDLNFTVAKDAANAAAANNAGLTVAGADAQLKYLATGDKWTMNKPLDVSGTISSGAITARADTDALFIKSVTNQNAAEIAFSSQGPSSYAQVGRISYQHGDTQAYGGTDVFTIGTTETAPRILADGLLMFKSGLALKPASGTGAGTTLITSSRALQNITTISSGAITATGLTVNKASESLANQPSIISTFDSSGTDGLALISIEHLTNSGASALGAGLRFQVGDGSTGTADKQSYIFQRGGSQLPLVYIADRSHEFYVDHHDNNIDGTSYADYGTLALTLTEAGNVVAAGTVTATGGNSAQWNTAYTYSQVGHLPLAGGTLTGELKVNAPLTIKNPVGTGRVEIGTIANDQQNSYVRGSIIMSRDEDQITYNTTTDLWVHAGGSSTDWSMISHTSGGSNFYTGPSVTSATTYTNAAFNAAYQWLHVPTSTRIANFKVRPTVVGNNIWHAGDFANNSTNWNTAYTTANAALPKAGGTMTGKLVLPDAGYSLGNEYHKWKRAYTINTSSPQEILYSDGNSLPTGGVYRFTAHIDGTGTDQFATAVYWNQNGTWRINVTGQSGTSSNHPEFIIDGTTNKPTIHIDHTSNYSIQILAERIELSEGTGTDNAGYAFGTDAFLGSVNNNLYFLPGGTAATGQNSYDDGNVVWHTGNLTTTNKSNYDTAYTYSQVGHLPLAGGTMTGTITGRDFKTQAGYHLQRSDHHSGHLEGSYNNVGSNESKSNPIYTIGSSYNPTAEAMSNMYGIGYSHTNASFISFTGASGWGMYAAADGDARVWLGAGNGVISSTGEHYVGSSRVFHDTYHPNADVWTTARNHTVTLTGDVTGTATQSVNGSGNKTWTVSTTAPVPSAPSITATSVVGETIEVTFSQSSTSGVDHYEVWSDGGSGTDYSLIARVPEEDIASSMSIIDSSFDDGGTIAYRAYAVKNGVYSTAATATRTYTVSTSLDVASLSVVPDINVYHINYNKPASRFIDHIEIYKDAEAVQGNLSRTGAALVYSGANSAFTYSIGASDLDKYHQFWVEVVAV